AERDVRRGRRLRVRYRPGQAVGRDRRGGEEGGDPGGRTGQRERDATGRRTAVSGTAVSGTAVSGTAVSGTAVSGTAVGARALPGHRGSWRVGGRVLAPYERREGPGERSAGAGRRTA